MSKYTTDIRWLVEQAEKDAHGSYVDGTYTEASYKALGLDSYPIFDEEYRPVLNGKIIDRFYFREIGLETRAQFAWFMRRRMNEIMKYYNQLYESEGSVKDPMSDTNLDYSERWDRGLDRKTSSDSDFQGTTTSDARNVFSDTPMSMLQNSGSPSVENLDYATNVTYDDSSVDDKNSTSSSGTQKDNEAGTKTHNESGRHQSESDLLKKWRSTFLNIDVMVLDDLEELFMTVY